VSRDELLRIFAAARTVEIVVTTMGAVRAWGRMSNQPELDFVSADSAMGHAADLALGIALARPERQVICFNGDGSMLMCLGTLATIIATGVTNLTLVVLQNGVYEITGGQAVPGIRRIDLAGMARAAGFGSVLEWRTIEEASTGLERSGQGTGPRFILAHVSPGSDGPIRRGPGVSEPFLKASIAESAHALRRRLQGDG